MEKVSVLSPCYNVEKYLSTFFDSIIKQNYRPIELILVNDGSTDNTERVIEEYRTVFEENEIELKYFYKENGGQASATAVGIKHVSGEYLVSCDPDDFLSDGSISERVRYMQEHPDCGMVRGNGYIYGESDIGEPLRKISKINRTTYLEDFAQFDVPWMPGCYTFRMSFFDKANPDRMICDSPVGQNIQMIMPIVYYYPCHYFDKTLCGYVIHKNSHSHSAKSYEQQQQRLDDYETCVCETLKIIPENTERYFDLHRRFIQRCKYDVAWRANRKEDMATLEAQMRRVGNFNCSQRIKKAFPPSKAVSGLLRIIGFVERKVGAV